MKLQRLQIDISEQRLQELEALRQECDVATKKELFNNALTLLEWAIKERKNGRIIASVDEKNMKFKELQMPILSAVGASA